MFPLALILVSLQNTTPLEKFKFNLLFHSFKFIENLKDVLDERLQVWRYRHVKMVERTIGNKPGSGGYSGVGFTVFQKGLANAS